MQKPSIHNCVIMKKSYRFSLLFLLCIGCSGPIAAATATHDMEGDSSLPSGWSGEWVNKKDAVTRAFRDDSVAREGRSSLSLISETPDTTTNIALPVPEYAGQKVELTGYLRFRDEGQGVQKLGLGLITGGPNYMQVLSINRYMGEPHDAWFPFSVTTTIPPESKLLFEMSGQGQVWLDDLKIQQASEASASAKQSDSPSGGTFEAVTFTMENGDAMPAGWGNPWSGKDTGKLSTGRDSQVAKSGEASLRLEFAGGSNNGNVQTSIRAPFAGQNVTVSGFIRIGDEGVKKAEVATLSTQGGGMKYKTRAVLNKYSPKYALGEWIPFSTTFVMPGNGRLLFGLTGEGTIWLDELTIKPAAAAQLSALKELRERKLNLNPIPRSDESPIVESVYTVAPDILALKIKEGTFHPRQTMPYEPQEGDKIQKARDKRGILREARLQRNGEFEGWIAGSNGEILRIPERTIGDILQADLSEWPQTYTISSNSDADYSAGVQPTAVYRKSKPTDMRDRAGRTPVQHYVYLKLPEPLEKGSVYTIDIGDLNVSNAEYEFAYDPVVDWSEAVHVNQIGYRPGDPAKRAYLSLWMGTGGGLAYPDDLQFALVNDETGEVVYRGEVELALAAHEIESARNKKNNNLTNVYRMDFSDFSEPGEYRVAVEGVGSSTPFPIQENVWENAFQVAMDGFLIQRSGIELRPPWIDYVRPRNYHPDDGVVVKQTTHKWSDDNQNFGKIIAGATDAIVSDVWGGYHDAGDWDRHASHLLASRYKLELFEMFPEYFESLDLKLPESDNKIPDIIDEVLWNVELFQRLQAENGSIRGGIEATQHPVKGTTSWGEPLQLYAFEQDDLIATYYYADLAGWVAYLLRDYDSERADELEASALKAMEWAEDYYADTWLPEEAENANYRKKRDTRDLRNGAALVLYRLTGDDKWHDIFLEDTVLDEPNPNIFVWRDAVQRYQAFFYAALLPEELADPQIRLNAKDGIVREATKALEFQKGMAFDITTPDPGRPLHKGFFTAPDAEQQLRAHYLTSDEKFLRNALLSTNYASGANPMNTVFTSGINENSIQGALHEDSRNSGRPTPPGITPFGHFDYDQKKNSNFMMNYDKYQNIAFPSLDLWPVAESYLDVSNIVMMNEFTVKEPMSQVMYAWGYLAARPVRNSAASVSLTREQ